MTAYVNYPLTASDDDEFFDAPVGSRIINTDGDTTHIRSAVGYYWLTVGGEKIGSGELWASFFPDGNPFGEHDITPGHVLRVTLDWANAYGLAEDREAAEAAAEARVAAMFAAMAS